MKTRKSYEVELQTIQPITEGEDFWMYRGYKTRDEALAVAKALSKFFPYFRYATQVFVKEFDVDGMYVHNEKIIKRYRLKDETGKVVRGSDTHESMYAPEC